MTLSILVFRESLPILKEWLEGREEESLSLLRTFLSKEFMLLWVIERRTGDEFRIEGISSYGVLFGSCGAAGKKRDKEEDVAHFRTKNGEDICVRKPRNLNLRPNSSKIVPIGVLQANESSLILSNPSFSNPSLITFIFPTEKSYKIISRTNLEKGLFSLPNLDLSNSGIEEFQQPEFEGYGPKTSKNVSKDISNMVRESPDAPLVKELVSNDKLEKKTVFLTVAKIEFVRPK
ncbi:hypothetical protein Tco_0038691 [Tanacetum coccineum]